MAREHLREDAQHLLPNLILGHTPLLAGIAFLGALLSASTSPPSGTLPGPSATFAAKVLERFPAKHLSDRRPLLTMRAAVAGFAVRLTPIALESESSISRVVGKAGKVTLATLRPRRRPDRVGPRPPARGGKRWRPPAAS